MIFEFMEVKRKDFVLIKADKNYLITPENPLEFIQIKSLKINIAKLQIYFLIFLYIKFLGSSLSHYSNNF